jgi:hypothetical protein
MKKYTLFQLLGIFMLIFFFGAGSVSFQVTFMQVDSGNTLGITIPGGFNGIYLG